MADTTSHGMPNLQMNFGYHWIWTYGHLIPAVTFASAAIAAATVEAPALLVRSTAAVALWAAAGFVVMRFVVRMDELGSIPTADFAPGKASVLDLGCGAGRTSVMVALARPEGRVVGLDNFSADYIDRHGEANTRANLRAAGVEDRVQIQSGDMRRIPFPDASFDGVVSSAAIDHLEPADIRATLAEANRVLRHDGQILLWLIVPNAWTWVAFGPLLTLHANFATRGDWRKMLDDAGFRINAEGTTRGLAWIQATRAREAVATNPPEVGSRPAIPRHVVWLSGALVVGGIGLQSFGFDAAGLWAAGAGILAIHLGAAFFGASALRGWLERRRDRTTVVTDVRDEP